MENHLIGYACSGESTKKQVRGEIMVLAEASEGALTEGNDCLLAITRLSALSLPRLFEPRKRKDLIRWSGTRRVE